MKISKEDSAFHRQLIKKSDKWLAERPITEPEKDYGQYLRTQERIHGYASGWIDGVRWAKRNAKKPYSP